MTIPVFTGHLYSEGRFVRATIHEKNGEIRISGGLEAEAKFKGTLMPVLANCHTHLGDSFIQQEPPNDLEESVGPGGFKHRNLEKANDQEIEIGLKRSLNIARESGTGLLADFREGGIRGAKMIREASTGTGIDVKILGRPATVEEGKEMIRLADGFGMSSLSDHDFEFLEDLSEIARMQGKTFAIHFSERKREDIDNLISLNPSLVVHGIYCRKDDLARLKEHKIPIFITPRSNRFYGLEADYSTFLSAHGNVCLGTDNGMSFPPDLFSEMAFLYLIQRSKSRIPPEEIIETALRNPWAENRNLGKIEPGSEAILFENEMLSSYEVVTKGQSLKKRIVKFQ